MKTFYLLVGIPVSGKSTVAKYLESKGAKVFSSDTLRKELGYQPGGYSPCLFNELETRLLNTLSSCDDVVHDATNLNATKRMTILKKVKRVSNYQAVCVVANTPQDVCSKRNLRRQEVLPEYVFGYFYRCANPPTYLEGWDKIVPAYCVYNPELYNSHFHCSWFQGVYEECKGFENIPALLEFVSNLYLTNEHCTVSDVWISGVPYIMDNCEKTSEQCVQFQFAPLFKFRDKECGFLYQLEIDTSSIEEEQLNKNLERVKEQTCLNKKLKIFQSQRLNESVTRAVKLFRKAEKEQWESSTPQLLFSHERKRV